MRVLAIPGLSAVIIARDAADRLPPCIRALAFADEILVYDGGSADATTQIAETLGARVAVDRDWQGFGRARQRAQDEARHEWILMVDSDERVTPALAQEIGAAIDAGDPCTAYALARRTWVFGRYLAHGGWWPDRVTRLYHREHGRYDDALVHEKVLLAPGTRLAKFASPLLHHSYRDMHEYLTKSADYAAAWAKTRERAGRDVSLAAGLAHGAGCFLRMYVLRAGFLDGRAGFLLALLSAHSTFVKYADLWLRSHDPGPPEAGGISG
ncbi:MAG TPA: glycosyltransferase family 2 protein [Gammaproteobacteria bacterium]|nr:glycosyltransferase family 2 protein [Gammaproteobacteria bacterium]